MPSELSRRTLLAAAVLLAAGCGTAAKRRPAAEPSASAPAPAPTVAATTPPPDPAAVHADESGLIPVLMHHRLVPHVDSEYDMTPAYFRAELERLHREGYFPVTTLQVARGDLGHVPAGRSPVVLTFDDSSSGQLHFDRSGAVASDSAVGMLRDFAREHPDFPAVASFYLNRDPFALGDPHGAVAALHDLGLEVGNHTYDHVPLDLPPAKAQQQLGELAAMVTRAVPGLAPRTMALPLGIEPSHPTLALAGHWRGTAYTNEAVLLVGANPAPSPFSTGWAPGAVPRIRSSSYQGGRQPFLATWWLDQLGHGGAYRRYVSAGNPGHVTVPRAHAHLVAHRHRAALVTY